MELLEIVKCFQNKIGIEVGGPSRMFMHDGTLPIYDVIQNLDGCNFSEQTLWESGLSEGQTYVISDKIGHQYICEATALAKRIEPDTYDCVVSSNCLEHIANPLKALDNFLYIAKKGGLILIVVPNKEATFDHQRPVTDFDHICYDMVNNIHENDLTHLNEILRLHDLSLDPPAGTLEQFKKRSLNNYENRGLHHHVFDDVLLRTMFKFLNIEELSLNNIGSDYLILGRKK